MKIEVPPIIPDKPELTRWLYKLRNLINSDYTSMNTKLVNLSKVIYFGDSNKDGTWRIIRSGTKLSVERRESGVFNSKFKFTIT